MRNINQIPIKFERVRSDTSLSTNANKRFAQESHGTQRDMQSQRAAVHLQIELEEVSTVFESTIP